MDTASASRFETTSVVSANLDTDSEVSFSSQMETANAVDQEPEHTSVVGEQVPSDEWNVINPINLTVGPEGPRSTRDADAQHDDDDDDDDDSSFVHSTLTEIDEPVHLEKGDLCCSNPNLDSLSGWNEMIETLRGMGFNQPPKELQRLLIDHEGDVGAVALSLAQEL